MYLSTEVTCFGSEDESDENDIWKVELFPDEDYDGDYVSIFQADTSL